MSELIESSTKDKLNKSLFDIVDSDVLYPHKFTLLQRCIDLGADLKYSHNGIPIIIHLLNIWSKTEFTTRNIYILDIITFLLKNGADVNQKTYNDKSALDIANEYNHGALVVYLKEMGAAVE